MKPSLARLPRSARQVIALARETASERSERLFLAGGVVRDLLLARPIHDVDLVLEGDVAAFARRLAPRLDASVRHHERFATAMLRLSDGGALDVAATRRETYPVPGALPSVVPGAPIEVDLERRDFAINAMAMELGPRPRLLDPLGGREDLARGVVRALHPESFRDDPTRAFRAVRYGNRLGFRIEPSTGRWLRGALVSGGLDRLSADRLRRELRLLFQEPGRAGAVGRLQSLAIDLAIDPALHRRQGATVRLRRAERLAGAAGASWLCYLLSWMGTAGQREAGGVALRLGLSGAEGRRLLAWPETTS
ncbi:MAG TPA: hypothetical protein VGG65_02800, partial [Thermoanaerobaculia bacterium]